MRARTAVFLFSFLIPVPTAAASEADALLNVSMQNAPDVESHDGRSARTDAPYFCPGDPSQTVYSREVSARKGDTLFIRAEVEITNDLRNQRDEWAPVIAEMRIVIGAQGQPATEAARVEEGVYPRGRHHLPLTAITQFHVKDDGSYSVRAEFAAKGSGPGPWPCDPSAGKSVLLNAGYGGLQIEHYRIFPSIDAAALAGSLALQTTANSETIIDGVSGYGRCDTSREAEYPYAVAMNVMPEDLAVVAGQSSVRLYSSPPSRSSCGPAGQFELSSHPAPLACRSGGPEPDSVIGSQIMDDLHGLSLRGDKDFVSFTASENVSICLPISTLSVSGVERIASAGRVQFATAVNGVTGYGGEFLRGGGDVSVLLFRPLRSSWSKTPLLLGDSLEISGGAVRPSAMVGQASALAKILRGKVTLGASATIRSYSFAQIEQPGGLELSTCRTEILLTDEAGKHVNNSPTTIEVSDSDRGELPMSNEAIFPNVTAGTYEISLGISCTGGSQFVKASKLGYMIFE